MLPSVSYHILREASAFARSASPTAEGKFSVRIDGLQPDCSYIAAAFMELDAETVIGNELSFKTLKPEYVDLGLSVDWAVANVGASSPSDYGVMLAWGEIGPKAEYTWYSYFDSPYDTNGNWVGCNSQTTSIQSDENHDAVTACSDGVMRMPTDKEVKELLNKCDWVWGELDGIAGYYVKSRVNANQIFLPAVGLAEGSQTKNQGTYGSYWTATIRDTPDKSTATNLYFIQSMRSTQYSNRYIGRALRGVHPK